MRLFEGVVLDRPWGLVALALPVVLWWLARRPQRPWPQAIGTFALWRELADEAAGERRVRSLPLAGWLLLASLAAGALALAGPRRVPPKERLRWSVLLDRGPSMYLPWRAEDAGAGDANDTTGASAPTRRIDRALDAFERWRAGLDLGRGSNEGAGEPPRAKAGATAAPDAPRDSATGESTDRGPGDSLEDAGDAVEIEWEWCAWTVDGPVRRIADEPPPEWLEAPWPPLDRPLEGLGAGAPVLVLTDRAPEAFDDAAGGYFASGGVEIHGPIAVGPDASWSSTPDGVLVEPPLARRLHLDPALPPFVADFARLWAEERGLECGDFGARAPLDPPGTECLALRVHALGPERPIRLAGDGWRLRGGGHSLPPSSVDRRGQVRALEPWFVSTEAGAAAWVAGAPGLVAIGLTAVDEFEGDAARFAVEWAERLDRVLLAPPSVLARTERAAAGPAVDHPPADWRRGRPTTRRPTRRWPLELVATAVATALALLAVALWSWTARA